MDISAQEEQFEQWTRDHGAILHRVVNGFASGADRNDLLQEVMLAVWKSIPSFRGEAKASTYLYRVSHNAALLWSRKERNYRRRAQAFDADQSEARNAGESDEERLEALYSAIHTLKPVDRSLILMSLDELSYREMAEVLGLSESNVGVRINRIKQQLSKTLKGNEHEHE